MRSILGFIFTLIFITPSLAEEKYSCFLDKFMEVANDGRFFGPEKTEEKLDINVRENILFYKFNNIDSQLPIIDKLGTAQFAAKGGIASMYSVHVWRRETSNKYDIQFTTNYAKSIAIRTGICFRN